MISVSLETTDPTLAKDAVRAFARRGFRRCRRNAKLTPNRWRCIRIKAAWFFEWMEYDSELRSNLTAEDVRKIRDLRKQGAKVADLASAFQVHVGTVEKILSGQRRVEP